jgi:hypothetical protein
MSGLFKLQYASNFFLNLQKRTEIQTMLKPECKNLALLGNICSLDTQESISMYKNFLRYTSYNWDRVYLVPGPYEYSSITPKNYKKCLEELYEIKESYNNITILNNSHVVVPNTDIQLIGLTLWARNPYLTHECMFEYSYIWLQRHSGLANLMGGDIVNWHLEDVHYIKSMINTNYRYILLTHHLPHNILHNDIGRMRMDSSNLEKMLHKPIEIWLGGAGSMSLTGSLGDSNDVFCGTNPYTKFNSLRGTHTASYNREAYVSLRRNIVELV